MSCVKLISGVNVNCPSTPKGYERVGWIFNWTDIDQSTKVYTNNYVKFSLKAGKVGYPIYDRSKNPFKGTKSDATVGDYYAKYVETVSFPMLINDPANAIAAEIIANGKSVIMLENVEKGVDDTSRYPIYGIDNGLTLTSEIGEQASDVAWVATLDSTNSKQAAFFFYDTDAATTATKLLLMGASEDYEYITGLTLASGTITPQKISVEVDSDKTAYVIQPDGTILTSVTGLIDTTWVGVAGSVTLIVPKDSSWINLGNGGDIGVACDFVGILNVNNPLTVEINGSQNIEGIDAQNSTNVQCSDCPSFTADSVKLLIDNAYSLFLNGQLTGIINAGGTTVGIDIIDISTVHVLSYSAIIQIMTGWTITINSL